MPNGYRYSRPDSLFSKDDLKIFDDLRKDKNIVIAVISYSED